MALPFSLDCWLSQTLSKRGALLWPGAEFNPMVRPADPRHGDFQANGILPLAREQKTAPRPLAEALSGALGEDAVLSEVFTWEVAGPGFINFSFTAKGLLSWLKLWEGADAIRSALAAGHPSQRVVVDFSSPNSAKQMHVGHIRSTVIGESIARILEFFGDVVTRDNHLGDWGTGFGLLLMGLRREGVDLNSVHDNPLAFIEGVYQRANALAEADSEAREEARQAVLALQQGEPEARKTWELINQLSYASFSKIYDLLNVRFDLVLGESFYCDQVEGVCRELESSGLAEESQGALVVFHPEHPRFREQPFIIRKANGASNYATTDLATVLYRAETLNAERVIYVVDARQSDHFEQLFLTARKWFAATGRPFPEMEHVAFGTILGTDGRPIKTRSGAQVRLAELLDEAVRRAEAIVADKNPDLTESEKARVARIIGINAVRYADLSQNRTSDYTFDWDKLLSFEGNTAPYLLYAVARIHGIFRRLGSETDTSSDLATPPETPGELRLARKLAQFGPVLEMARNDLRPHVLSTYLFELAVTFSSFYDSDKVAVEDPAIRQRRLLLCRRSLLFLTTGLDLLGIPVLERM